MGGKKIRPFNAEGVFIAESCAVEQFLALPRQVTYGQTAR
jgi:hypothetical protein